MSALPGVLGEMLQYGFMQRALLAAVLVGVTAPMVGTFLVQRRLSLIGDGLGHVALAGVAVGVLTATSPVWAALVAAVAGAVLIELLRTRGRTSGDVALAVLFYGGLALGVVLIARAPSGQAVNLTSYLFGAITTTTPSDVVVFAVLSAVVLVVVLVLARPLFAVSNDEEHSRAAGLPVLGLNLVLAVLTAVTIVVSMRVIGVLLISALMILPNAVAQRVSRSFTGTMVGAVAVGVSVAASGVVLSYGLDTPSGGTIVCLAVVVFLLVCLVTWARTGAAAARHPGTEYHPHEHGPHCGHPGVPHEDHVDYVHDGHRHAPHRGHYDEH